MSLSQQQAGLTTEGVGAHGMGSAQPPPQHPGAEPPVGPGLVSGGKAPPPGVAPVAGGRVADTPGPVGVPVKAPPSAANKMGRVVPPLNLDQMDAIEVDDAIGPLANHRGGGR